MRRRDAPGAAAVAAIALAWRSSPGTLVGATILSVVAGVSTVPAAWLSRDLVNELGSRRPNLANATVLAIAVPLLGALALSVTYLSGALSAILEARIEMRAELDLVDALNRQIGIARFENPTTLDDLQIAKQGVTDGPMAIAYLGMHVVGSTGTLFAYLVLLGTTWPFLALTLILVAAGIILGQVVLGRAQLRVSEATADAYRWREYYTGLLTNARSAREIRLFHLERFVRGRLESALDAALGREARQHCRSQLAQAAFMVVHGVVGSISAVIVIRGVLTGRLTVGDFVLFTAAVGAIQSGLTSITANITGTFAALGRFRYFIGLTAAGSDLCDGSLAAPKLKQEIEFRDVWFRYAEDAPWVLKGFDLKIPARTTFGLVGTNGAGKSTIVKLLLRMYDPVKGQILWDGSDLRDLSVSTLRSRVTAVFQDYVAFELSLNENVTLGDVDTVGDSDSVRSALSLVGLDRLIANLPSGTKTMLSPTRTDSADVPGTSLSGGQWQRISIARALYRRHADLILLDEPNAGLDVDAENEVNQAVAEIGVGRTRVLVSHRLSALRAADHIAVLIDGVVAEIGGHDELINTGGEYARLFLLQAAGYQ